MSDESPATCLTEAQMTELGDFARNPPGTMPLAVSVWVLRALTELRELRAAGEWRGNGAEVQSWLVGKNMSPHKEERAEGEFEVRFTFSDVAVAKAWAMWALSEDAAPSLPAPPPREG